MSLTIGQPAPDFALYSSEKELITLNSLRGQKIVLLFFPLAFTRVCTAELCETRDDMGMYDSLEAKIFGISGDSPQTLAKFKESLNLNFTLLSDYNKEAMSAYDAKYNMFPPGLKDVAKRAVFIIDTNGILAYQEVLENAGDMPDLKRIKEELSMI